ncbi:MAG TPA: 2-dehydropantoate 2-reductase, partial [Spongiibacteraceae bacterium]
MINQQRAWHLLGTGAIGCLFAAYLRRAGVALQAIVRDDATLQQLHANSGFALRHGDECTTIAIDAATPETIAQPITQLLICTKAQQTLTAVTAIKAHFAVKPLLILLQNGMGVRELVQREIPDATILHAITTEGAYRSARFDVAHAGRGNTVIGAILPQQQLLAEYAVRALQCELPIAMADDMQLQLWIKLAVNCVINPLSAIHRCRNGELLQLPAIDTIVAALCDEFVTVANAEGLSLHAAQLREAVYRVMRDTAQNRSSMLQDIEAGR